MPTHAILPDTEVLGELVLPKETDLLEGKIALLVCQPLLLSEKFSFFIMVKCHALAADRHIFLWVSLSVCYNLVVVGVVLSV